MSDAKLAHIVPLPSFVFFIRVFTTVLSIVILGLVGYTLNKGTGKGIVSASDAQLDPIAFVVFAVVWTWLVNAYLIVTPLWFPVAYNMWGHLFGDVTATLFWLAGFAAAGDWASSKKRWYVDFEGNTLTMWKTAAAASGLGAIMWICFLIITVVYILRLHRFRNDPANQHLSPFGFSGEKGGHELGHVQQQQQYPQQSDTPVQYPVQPTPPPQGWAQSPPPAQYAQ
ncbi:hypothetical protein DFH27DRAFT_550729 [Peziza echinospora]|nr:hypothetical protein DFH27DRAFT_550729 [Peziza echinospora]